MRVLVTGGGGFLGSAICRQLLARGDEVIAYQRSDNNELEKTLDVIKENKLCVICGDFNINIMNNKHYPSTEFINLTLSQSYINISCPTRITNYSATLIDNTFLHWNIDCLEAKITLGNLLTDITHHFHHLWNKPKEYKEKQAICKNIQ